MKRYAYLFEQLCDLGHLYRSYRTVLDISDKPSKDFSRHLDEELLRLKQALISGTYRPGQVVLTHSGSGLKAQSARVAFRDQLVRQAVLEVLKPVVNLEQDPLPQEDLDALATVGQEIDHEILMRLIRRKIRDKSLLNLIRKIIQHGNQTQTGVSIDQPFGRFLTCMYMKAFNPAANTQTGFWDYWRYLDDVVLFATNWESRWRFQQQARFSQ